METITLGERGELELPREVQERYGFKPAGEVRLVPMDGGVLLVPVGPAGMTPELKAELEQWEALSAEAWAMFPYESEEP
jgi:hypothetical protein